jgi:lysophospholipase L1-like esterase
VRRTLALNLVTLAALVALVEAGGQIYYWWTSGASLAARSRQYLEDARVNVSVFEQHPYLVARPRAGVRIGRGAATISTTPQRTRTTGTKPPRPDAITVAAMGGSTTFGTRISDADTWPWLLQERLGDRYAVMNYGVPGYTTAENIIQMSLVVPESKPQIVIFYEGWNDIRNYHWPGFEPDYAGHGMTQFDTLIPAVVDRASLLSRAARYSYVMRLIGRAAGVPLIAWDVQPSATRDPEVDRVYVRNLQTLKALAARFGTTALFVPQVLNTEALQRAGDRAGWAPYVKSTALSVLMRDFNALMASVCADGEPGCRFVSEPLEESWNNDDFVDEGHLSRRGGEKLAAILAARILGLERDGALARSVSSPTPGR